MNKFVLIGLAGALFSSPAWAAKGQAKIAGTAEGSTVSGLVNFEDAKEGLKVSATVENVSPGDHGFHIHEFGACGDAGKNAGGHYNPGNTPHGEIMKDGQKKAHAGDMGNISVGADGKGTLDVVIPGVTLIDGKRSVAGRAVILHEKTDDFGQPVGNAGSRIGCGVIFVTGK